MRIQFLESAMCRYRYYYFLGCRHQQTVLLEFCENAQAIDGQQECAHVQRDAQDLGGGRLEAISEERASPAAASEESVTATDNKDDLSSMCSTTLVGSSSHSPKSTPDIGSTSTSVEPCLDCISLQPEHSSHFQPSVPEASPADMAGLPKLFNFQQWMAGGSVSTPKETDQVVSGELHSLRQQIPNRHHRSLNIFKLDRDRQALESTPTRAATCRKGETAMCTCWRPRFTDGLTATISCNISPKLSVAVHHPTLSICLHSVPQVPCMPPTTNWTRLGRLTIPSKLRSTR